MSAKVFYAVDAFRSEFLQKTKLVNFPPGGNNVTPLHAGVKPAAGSAGSFVMKRSKRSKLRRKKVELTEVVIKLASERAFEIFNGISVPEKVGDPTVRKLVSVCRRHKGSWISLKSTEKRPHSSLIALDLLLATVAVDRAEPFRQSVRRIPEVKDVLIPRG